MWPFTKTPKQTKPTYSNVTIGLSADDSFEQRARNAIKVSGLVFRDEIYDIALNNIAELLEVYSKLDKTPVESAENKTDTE
jgi:hypothetical protein